MKTLPISLLFVLPLIGLSQGDDHCPCMDFRNDYNNVSDYSSSVDQSANQLTTSQSMIPLNQAFGILIPEMPPEPVEIPEEEPPLVQEIEPEAHPVEAIQKEVSPERSPRRSAVKRSKKRRRGRVKARKKMRKYRGQCPLFMP